MREKKEGSKRLSLFSSSETTTGDLKIKAALEEDNKFRRSQKGNFFEADFWVTFEISIFFRNNFFLLSRVESLFFS